MKVTLFHLCDHAFLDARTNPCLISVAHRFFSKTFPYHRAVITAAIMLDVEPDSENILDFTFGIESGPELRRTRLNLRSNTDFAFTTVQMVQVFFPSPGLFVARLTHQDQTLAQHALHVVGI